MEGVLPLVNTGEHLPARSSYVITPCSYFQSTTELITKLGGGIPEEVSSLTGLVNLNLSWNQLTGTTPQDIGEIQKLDSLDLSMNVLSGAIPPSLSDLTSLGHLNLSYNNLSGTIPSGNQLQALANPAYIYIGNVGLCGPPLPKNCSSGDGNNSSHVPQHEDKDLPKSKMFFYLGLPVGFVVGLCLVFCSLLFLKTWRFTYFWAIDKAYDVLYVFVAVRFGKPGEKRTSNSAD